VTTGAEQAVASGGEGEPQASGGEGELGPRSADADAQFRKAAELAPAGAQLVLVSPALDGGTVDALETWAAFDRPRTLLSPDVVPSNTVSGRLEGVERSTRLARCQSTGARTIDWRRGTPLGVVLGEAFAADARATGGGV
jgi:hypothetical protein